MTDNYTAQMVTFTVAREQLPGPSLRELLNNPRAVAGLARCLIPDDAREHFLALYLDSQNRLVATHEVSVGTLSGTLVHPREVFGPAVRLLGVASVILVHNHPSGDTTPSREDLLLTRKLVKAGEILDVTIHDHVVIAHGGTAYTSLAQMNGGDL